MENNAGKVTTAVKRERVELSLSERLLKIQGELKAPKGQYNKFGNYKYRSCEDVLEALKPLLTKYGVLLLLSDSIELIGDRVYVKATAELLKVDDPNSHALGNIIRVSAFARESLSKKGMDESQITGAASSYARKYALNGLFSIDDARDADSQKPAEIVKTSPKADAGVAGGTKVAQSKGIDYISGLKSKLFGMGAKDEAAAIGLINTKTSITINAMAELTPAQAQRALAELLQSTSPKTRGELKK